LKSEYIEAYDIQTQILHESCIKQDRYNHGLAALNVAQLQISMDAPKQEVQKNIDTAKLLLVDMEARMAAECMQADLSLRDGQTSDANISFCKNLRASWGKNSEAVAYCLERLADVSQWHGFHCLSPWPTVFLVHSLRSKEKLGIHKALQFLGDLFLAQDDEDTAVSLFTIALEGFTNMDVHRNRAECMLCLGDISKGCGDLLQAVELWETARPLFERSSQDKQVKNIDERLASVGEDVLEQHRANLARLVELKAPSSILEEGEQDLSNFEEDTA
jgi:tetratricopeptide (TPR) repeat protein